MKHFKGILLMHLSRIIFLLGFNMLASSTYSATEEVTEQISNLALAPAPTEQPIIINDHTLETVAPGKSMEDVLAARQEFIRSLMILVDLEFGIFGGVPLNLTPLHLANPDQTIAEGRGISTTELLSSFDLMNLMANDCRNTNLNAILTNLNIAVNRVLSTTQLESLLNDIKDPAAIVILLEKAHFYPKPDSIQKAILMAFMNTDSFTVDREALLLKASSAKRANSKKNNTIAARHLWSIGWAESLLGRPWDILSPQQQTDVQDLDDCGSVTFKCLKAFYFFKDKILNDETLDINTRIRKLAELNTDARHDFWRATQWSLLSTNQIPEAEAEKEWFEFFIAIAMNNLPLSQSLAFTPIEKSRDSTTWPIGYKAALYSVTGLVEETVLPSTSTNPQIKLVKTKKFATFSLKKDYSNGAPLLEVLRVLAEEVKTVSVADLYLKDFLRDSTAHNPENNAERIAEVDRICAIVPGAKQIIADAICQFDQPLFTTEILIDLGLATPAERLQKLRELSDQGIERASFYLATAYTDSLFEATPLVTHLGIQSRESLSIEERTFGNLAQIHKENTIELIRLGLSGNKLAQHFLFEKSQGSGFSIIEKLFDDRLALSGAANLGPTPCGIDQHNMNRMLMHTLRYAFNVSNILHAQNDVPEFFFEQIRQRLLPASNA
jgi:hypothetical protein